MNNASLNGVRGQLCKQSEITSSDPINDEIIKHELKLKEANGNIEVYVR